MNTKKRDLNAETVRRGTLHWIMAADKFTVTPPSGADVCGREILAAAEAEN